MQTLIDATVQYRLLHDRRTPASIGVIREHLDEAFNAVQHDNKQRDKSYSGIRARIMFTTIDLIYDTYQKYLLNIEILNSDFFILVRDVIARSFNETRHELVSEDEKKLLGPVCDIVLKIADSMTPELADCNMISLFFGKTFVLSMTECLKAFAEETVTYGMEQKAMIIKAILNMFSGYCVVKGDETVSNAHVIGLVNAALCCVSSRVYLRIFNRVLRLTSNLEQLTPDNELFLIVCPKYVISYTKARREPMFAIAKDLLVKTAAHIFHQFIPRITQISLYLLKCVNSLVELLLLIPARSFSSSASLINDLLNVAKLSKNNSITITNEETKKFFQRTISLIYTLSTDPDLGKLICNSLPNDEVLELFDELSSVSLDKHIQFTSALIVWTLNRENTANRKYSSQMIETFVHYLNECEGDPLQQCNGLPLDSMITTLSDFVENEDAQKELIKQEAVPVIVKCASEIQFDIPTVQQPSLECLWTMAFTPDVLMKLIESPEFLAHLKILLKTSTTTATTDNDEESSDELARVADGLLWKIEKEPVLLMEPKSTKQFKYDIMISYQHGDFDICQQIYSRLINQNQFRVWFDQQNMYGPVMNRMAEGVEMSEFILVCMSEGYTKSRYCRSEATYAYQIKRYMIPIKLHRNFKATGWLGMTIGDLLYIDFSGKHSFDNAYEELIGQIEKYRNPEVEELPVPVPVPSEERCTPSPLKKPKRRTLFVIIKDYLHRHTHSQKFNGTELPKLNSRATSAASTTVNTSDDISHQSPSMTMNTFVTKQMKDWTCNDVEDFLRKYQLDKFKKILSQAEGNYLFRLYSMSKESDNKLLEYMKDENPEIKLSDYLRFIQIIDDHIQQTNTQN